ncbi:hypothetical protein Nmel_003231, partial [Mimus melanotis]
IKTAVNAQVDHKTLPWQQRHQLARWEEKNSISGTGSQVVWASLPADLQLLWDQQDAQGEPAGAARGRRTVPVQPQCIPTRSGCCWSPSSLENMLLFHLLGAVLQDSCWGTPKMHKYRKKISLLT